jgi:hypothetical protein
MTDLEHRQQTLAALDANRARIIPGRLFRLMFGLIPASVIRNQTSKMFHAALKAKALRGDHG